MRRPFLNEEFVQNNKEWGGPLEEIITCYLTKELTIRQKSHKTFLDDEKMQQMGYGIKIKSVDFSQTSIFPTLSM